MFSMEVYSTVCPAYQTLESIKATEVPSVTDDTVIHHDQLMSVVCLRVSTCEGDDVGPIDS